MSALGQKQTSAPQKVMSVLPSKRTFAVQTPMSAKGQKRTSRHSLDHFVGAGEPLRMNFEAKRLGGLEVDHELESDGTRERRWALMNWSAKRFDPPGTVARTLLI
jgi:hypothetical protein